MSKQPYQPIFILPEGSQRNSGKEAQRMNIAAAKIVAETVRTTLGPKGMDKMLVDATGEVTVTNDGVTILREMNIEHPSAKMVVEIAKTQEDEVGDGTTTAVVLAGELLKQAETLLEQDIHPTVIVKGYRVAAEKAQVILNNISEPITAKDKSVLKKVAMTAMTGKGAENNKEDLSSLIIDAVIATSLEKENIKIEKKVGGRADQTELIKGIVLDRERVHPSMPKEVQGAKILLIDAPLEIKSTDTDAKITITDPDKLQGFLDMEENMLKDMVAKIESTGATVVFCQKGIDDLAQHFLAKRGIYAVRRVRKADMEKLAKATGASIVSDFKEIKSSDLGKAGMVEEVKVGDEGMTYVRECKNPKSVTILVRGGTEHIIAEVTRALEDAIGDTISSLKHERVVAGAGAPEIELARNLRLYSEKLSGKEQLAVQAFGKAMEVIPRTLAENAGLDPIDVIANLKAAHEKGQKWAGINVFSGKVMDAWKEGVIEPLQIKTQAVSSAAEVAVMILRIDDVIVNDQGQQQGPSPDMHMPEM